MININTIYYNLYTKVVYLKLCLLFQIATVQKHNLLTDFILAFEDLVQCFTENENDNVFRIMEKIFDKLQ